MKNLKAKKNTKSRAKSENVSEGCGGRCATTYAQAGANVRIVSATECQLDVRTGAPVAGTERILVPLNLPRDIADLIQRRLADQFVYSAPQCRRGCFCNPEGLSDTREADLTYEPKIIKKKKRLSAWVLKGSDTREQILEKLRNGTLTATDNQTGQPVSINPNLDELVVTFENCCAQIEIELDILNWFEYAYRVTGTFTLVDLIGECQSVHGGVLT